MNTPEELPSPFTSTPPPTARLNLTESQIRERAIEISIEDLPALVRSMGTAADIEALGKYATDRPLVALLMRLHGSERLTVLPEAILAEWDDVYRSPDQQE